MEWLQKKEKKCLNMTIRSQAVGLTVTWYNPCLRFSGGEEGVIEEVGYRNAPLINIIGLEIMGPAYRTMAGMMLCLVFAVALMLLAG